MLEDLSTKDLRAIDGLMRDWISKNRHVTVAEASPEQVDILVTYYKVKRVLAERCIADEF
jgi:uncharacterized protein YcbK (DUF882 family)